MTPATAAAHQPMAVPRIIATHWWRVLDEQPTVSTAAPASVATRRVAGDEEQ